MLFGIQNDKCMQLLNSCSSQVGNNTKITVTAGAFCNLSELVMFGPRKPGRKPHLGSSEQVNTSEQVKSNINTNRM